MAQIALTESTVMEAWKPEKAAPLYRKSIVLEVIGKSSVVLTKNSAYQHVFLSNGKKFYRLIVWKEKLDEAAEKLKLQSVVRLSGIKVDVFFTKDKDVVPTELHNSLQFICISDTRITVLFRKPMVDYPDKNPFPPFWKLINEICVGDSEIAMRALLLVKPVQKSISSNNGICRYIGDKSGFQVFLFVAFNVEKQDEKEAAEDFQASMEVLLAGGKVIRTTDDKVLLMVENIYCLKRVDDADKKLTRLKSYQEAKPSSPPPAKEPPRSDFF